jgi:hypothetical protein
MGWILMAMRVNTNKYAVRMIGESMIFLGMGTLAIMSLAGYIALILLMVYATREQSYHHRSHCCHSNDGFWTGFFVGSMFSSRQSNNYGHTNSQEMVAIIGFSLLVSTLAIAFSFAYGFALVGLALAIGWAASVAIIALGALIYNSSELFQENIITPEPHAVFA